MPTTVSELLISQELNLTGKIKWSQSFRSNHHGVYIVSLSKYEMINNGIIPQAPISMERIEFWLNKVQTFELDHKRHPSVDSVIERLSRFWLPDENILYIGMTTATLSVRISQYYNTELGEKRPHAGGHWIKTLSNLSELYVYYSQCDNPEHTEINLLDFFSKNVSEDSIKSLYDSSIILPFANLEHPIKGRKKHGIGKSKLN